MANTRKILYWHGVVGDVFLRAQYSKVLEKLMNGEYAAAKYHKLKDYDVYSVYEDGKDRLIVTTEEIDGKPYLLVLKALPDHDYHNLDKTVLKRYIERNREQIAAQARAEWEEVDEQAIEKRFEKIKSAKEAKDLQINFSPADYQQDKCIEYNEKQKDIIGAQIWGTKGYRKLLDLQGPAGSGKSLVALVMAENYEEGDVIYLAPTEILARDSEAKFKQMRAGKPLLSHAVEFFSRKEYFMHLHPDLEFADSESDKEQHNKWQFVDEEEFVAWLPGHCESINNWAKQQKIEGVLRALKKHADLIHQEFFSLGIHDNESSYQNHPDERAIFAKGAWRQLVWKMYIAYKKYLPSKKFIDINLASIELKKQEKLIIIDEAHDLSLHDLCYLPNIFRDCVLISDPHQRTVSCLSMVPDLKEFLKRQDLVPYTLTDPMRYSAPTARVANAAIKFKCIVAGGTPYKGAYLEIPITAEHEKKPGEGIFLTTTEVMELKKMVAELKKKFSILDEIALAIPGHKKIPEHVKEWFDGDLIFTHAKQIKGLGYKVVIMFEPFKEGIFQANRKYRALTQSVKPVVDQAQGINGDIIFNKDINEFFTFLTRNSHTFVICQKVDRNIDELAKLIRAAISPGVTVMTATVPEAKDKREDKPDEARSLAEAQKQVHHGNYEIAKNIFKRLGKSDREYAEFEKQHKVQLRQQKKSTPEIASASSRSPDAPGNIIVAPGSEASTASVPGRKERVQATSSPSPDAFFASGSALPGHKAHVQATPASTSKIIKKIKIPGQDTVTKFLPMSLTAKELFKREKDSCLFLKIIEDEASRNHLLSVAKTDPDYFNNISLLDLFESYQVSFVNVSNIPIILLMLMFSDFQLLLKLMLARLSDHEVGILIKKMQEEYQSKISGKEYKTSVLCTAIDKYPDFLMFLINAYPKLANMLDAGELSRLREVGVVGGKHFTSPIELISQSKIACEFYDKCRRQNPRLLTEIKPEAMFRIYELLAEGNKVKTTVYNNTLISHGSEGLQLLADWLVNNTWIEFIYHTYKTKTHKELIIFNKLIINSLIDHWMNMLETPMQRFLNRYPDFLFMLVKHGFFVMAENSPSTFRLLSRNSAYHSALKILFDSDSQYYSEIDFKEFFDARTNKHGLVEADVPLSLAQSEAGALLLKNIINARKVIRENLASAAVLCSPRLLAGAPLQTCLYLTLKTTAAGKEIIEQLQQRNPSLNSEAINRLLIANNLDYLDDEELASIESVKREFTFDNLLALLVKPNVKRLLFTFDEKTGAVFSGYLIENNDRLALLCDVIRAKPKLVFVLPLDFLWLGIGVGAHSFTSNLKLLLAQPAGHDVIRLLCKEPDYSEHISIESLFVEPGYTPAHKLFDDIIRDKKLRWLLDELVEHKKFVVAITTQFFSHKIVDGAAFSVICRYHPDLIIKLAQKVQQDASLGMTPAKMIFGNPGMIVQNFYWLSKHPPAHELLLSIFEAEPALLDRLPASAFGLTLKAWPDAEEESALITLTQSEAGRKIIGLYIVDHKRAKQLTTPALCCKVFKGKNVMSELSRLSPDLLEQFDPQLVARGLNVITSPDEVFRVTRLEMEDGEHVTTSTFCNLSFHIKDKFDQRTHWFELNDAWIDYIINQYKTKSHDDLLLVTELIICPLLYHWRTTEKPPLLRLLQKHPDFISQLVSNGLFTKVVSSGLIEKIAIGLSVFDLLCLHPAYHTYLHNSVSWGRFQQLNLDEFFENSLFNLLTTTDGLKFLYSVLMLRPDICKRLATFDELFAQRSYETPDGVITVCLFDVLSQREEGKGILKLLQQTNKTLVLPTDQALHGVASLLSSMRPGK